MVSRPDTSRDLPRRPSILSLYAVLGISWNRWCHSRGPEMQKDNNFSARIMLLFSAIFPEHWPLRVPVFPLSYLTVRSVRYESRSPPLILNAINGVSDASIRAYQIPSNQDRLTTAGNAEAMQAVVVFAWPLCVEEKQLDPLGAITT